MTTVLVGPDAPAVMAPGRDSAAQDGWISYRQRPFTTPARVADRLSFAWLALALVLLPFGTARWAIPLAAWLYPVFLLRFVRSQPAFRGFFTALLTTLVVLEVAWIGFLPPGLPAAVYVALVAVVWAPVMLAYLLDRLVAPRVGGLLGTLVFPSAVTTVWYAMGQVSPQGSMYNPAYTQAGELPLLQLLSVTGLWGIVFLISWFAAMVNWAWDQQFAWRAVHGGVLGYAALLGLVLLGGGVRLALFPPQGDTVRVAGITAPRELFAQSDELLSRLPADVEQRTSEGQGTPTDRDRYRQAFAIDNEALLTLTEQEARSGAKIVLWTEDGARVVEEDQEAFLERVGVLAQSTGTYLETGLGVLLQQPEGGHFAKNESLLVDPQGSVRAQYLKSHLVPGPDAILVPGDGRVQTVQTPYGRLAAVVCYDGAFPDTMRQAGQAGADIAFMASNDWPEVSPYLTPLMTYRAIENGYSLVRQTSNGLSMAVDYQGRVLATADYFTTDPQIMIANVPVQGVRTIYAAVGDLFAWLSIAGLVGLVGVAVARRRAVRRDDSTSVPTTRPYGGLNSRTGGHAP